MPSERACQVRYTPGTEQAWRCFGTDARLLLQPLQGRCS